MKNMHDCPACHGKLALYAEPVDPSAIRLKFKRRFVACESCPLVSEVSSSGQLLDLGDIYLDELKDALLVTTTMMAASAPFRQGRAES